MKKFTNSEHLYIVKQDIEAIMKKLKSIIKYLNYTEKHIDVLIDKTKIRIGG